MDIKFICFDFDGVFTNGKIYEINNLLNKYYDIKDGMGLKKLRDNNIKYGLITGFKNKKYLVNDNNIDCIIKHLNFDYIKLGTDNKLSTLYDWINELKINYINVAYIGDDINDIDIIKEVGFSACPNDAVKECKDIVNYICNKNGGDGCVREFIDKIIDLQSNKSNKSNKNNKYNKILYNIKRESNYQINNLNIDEIEFIANLICDKNKNIYCTGVGKSENIAIHLSNLLKSIGIKSYFLDCLNSIPGDIGTIEKDDIVLIFSKSANTSELINIINALKLHNPYLISISCNKNGVLNKLCDKYIILPLKINRATKCIF